MKVHLCGFCVLVLAEVFCLNIVEAQINAPDIRLTGDTYFIGDVVVGRSGSVSIPVYNDGNTNLVISSITSSNALFTISPSSMTVYAGWSNYFTVTFTPTASGAQNTFISIVSNDPDESPLGIGVSGTGLNPKITVTSPDGGENLVAGSVQSIMWTCSDVPYIMIEYTTNGGWWWETITSSTSTAAGHYQWTVPNLTSSNCLVRLTDTSNSSVTDQSNGTFTISQRTITVTAPNYGESWVSGTLQDIKWTVSNVTNVKIEYSTDGGTTWNTITASINGARGYYNWTVPNITSGNCLIRISDTTSPIITDICDKPFIIIYQKWQCECGYVSTSPALGKDGVIYFCSSDNYLYAYKPDGTLKWGKLLNSIGTVSPVIGGDGNIYVVSSNALNVFSSEGLLKWETVSPIEQLQGTVIVGVDGTIYAGSSSYGYLYAITPSGVLKWKNKTGDQESTTSHPLGIGSDGTIYVWCNKTIYALKPDGTQKWKYQAECETISESMALGSDGTIYFTTYGASSYVYALNPDGTLKWRYQYGSYSVVQSPVCGNDGILYVTADNYLLSFDNDGTLKWKFSEYEGYATSSPMIAGDGTIYYGSGRNLKAINPDGTLKWKCPTTDPVASPPAIGNDGAIYFGCGISWYYSKYGFLVVDSGTNAGLEGGSWPRFAHDLQNTGRVSNVSYVELLLPNGDEPLVAGSSYSIRWNSPGVTTVKLEYSTNNGSTWSSIAASIAASTGSYSWSIPKISSASCLVRISDTSNATMNDQSNASFSIATPELQLTSPNGPESLSAGTTQNITWTSAAVANVKIEYSSDGGKTWTTIIATTSASVRSYSWKVPNMALTDCYVRISDTANPAVTDTSDLSFSISTPGDFNSDGAVSLADFVLFCKQYGTKSSDSNWISKFDLTNDGTVDFGDLVLMASKWTGKKNVPNAEKGSFMLDTDFSKAGYQGLSQIANIQGYQNIGFALYLTDVNNIKGFTVKFDWDGSKAAFRDVYSSVNINDDELTINGSTVTPQKETNILGENLISIGETSTTGHFENCYSSLGVSASFQTQGLLYFAVFRTASNFTFNDSLSVKASVIISDLNGNEQSLGSRYFYVNAPSVQITSPKGGETWASGSSQNITWTSSRVTNVKIEYSTNGGGAWNTIVASTAASSGSYSWTVPKDPSTTCFVRISDASNAAMSDISDAPFTIIVPTVHVTSPNGGESWDAKSTHNVAWTSDSVSKVKIQYSLDDGATWSQAVASVTASTGSYSWTLPAMYSNRAWVRIIDTMNASVADTSNNNFKIIAPEIRIPDDTYAGLSADAGASGTITIPIYNDGNATLTVNDITSDNPLFTVSPKNITIPENGSTTVTVTFSPQTWGTQTAVLTITSNDPDEGTVTVKVVGTGWDRDVMLQSLSLAMDEVAVGTVMRKTFPIINEGNRDLIISSIASSNSVFSVEPASSTITPGGVLTVTVAFTPTTYGVQSGQITITSNDRKNGTLTVAVSGTGLAPDIEVTAASLDFGNVDVGIGGVLTLTIKNNGNALLIVNSIKSDNTVFTVIPTSITVPAGQSQTATVTFTPTAWGTQGGLLTILSNDPYKRAVMVSVGGTGYSPEITLSTASITFGEVDAGSSATGTFTITNEGNKELVISTIVCDRSVYTVAPTSLTIPAGQSQTVTVTVTFTPVEMGDQAGIITVTSDDPDEGSLTIHVSGTGLAAKIRLSATTLDIGGVDIGKSSAGTFEITNDGNRTLEVTGIGSDNTAFTVTPATAAIPVGQSKTVIVTFRPTMRGKQTGSITIASNGTEGDTTISIGGEGLDPEIVLSTQTVALGEVDVGGALSGTLVIRNEGNAPLTVDLSVDNALFTFAPTSASIPAGDSLVVVITFSPKESDIGEKKGTLTITSNDRDEKTLTVMLSGTGRKSPLVFSPSELDIGDVTVGDTGVKSVTVTNSGNVEVELKSIVVESGLFTVGPKTLTLKGGQSGEITVTYSPVVPGVNVSNLVIVSTIGGQTTHRITVRGRGVGSDIAVSAGTLAIGSVVWGGSVGATFTITNNGNADLAIEGIGSDNPVFTAAPERATVQPGKELVVTVTFTPDRIGAAAGTISVVSNDYYEAVVSIAVSGTGIESFIKVERLVIRSDAGYNAATDTLDVVLSVRNTGEKPVSDVTFACSIEGQEIPSFYGTFDGDGDGDIDILKNGESIEVLVSRTPVQSLRNEQALTVNRIGVSGDTHIVSFSTPIVFTYAQQNTGPYKPWVDGYGFENPPGWSWKKFLADCREYDQYFDEEFQAVFPFFSSIAQWKGRCFGMAAASNVYFENPSLKPAAGITYRFKQDDPGVVKDIALYSISTLYRYITMDSPFSDDMTGLVSDAKGYIAGNRPFILILWDSGHKNAICHAVSVYKVIEDVASGEAFLVVYDGAYADGLPRFARVSTKDGTFTYGDYDKAGILLQSALTSDFSIGRMIIKPYKGKFIADLWNSQENFFGHASPARMLVTDVDTGKRIGFVNGADFVSEIVKARMVEIPQEGDTGYAFYVPHGPTYDMNFYGLNDGTMYVNMITPQSDKVASEVQFEDVSVEKGTVAVIENVKVIEETAPLMKLDLNATGVFTDVPVTEFGQLRAETIAPPTIALSSNTVNNGKVEVNEAGSATLTISNTGDEYLEIKRISIDNENFTVMLPPTSIAPGKSENLSVLFQPKNYGEQTAILTIESNDPNRNVESITVSGEGIGLHIVGPNGGEKLAAGSTCEISWEVHGISQVRLEYSIDGGQNWRGIAQSVSADILTYTWTIPNTESQMAVVRILDNSNSSTYDTSDTIFTIIPIPITITHTAVTEAPVNTTVKITSIVRCPAGVKSVTLSYRESGKTVFKSVAMTSTNDSTYAYTLPGSAVTSKGIEYYITAEDAKSNRLQIPKTGVFYSIAARVAELPADRPIAGGPIQTAYRMVSVPLILDEDSIEQQMSGRIPSGKYGPDWRLVRFPSGSTTFQEYPNIEGFSPGAAFWFIGKKDFQLVAPSGKTVSTSEPFEILLKPGWNDIANPWLFNISWKDVEVPSDAQLSVLYSYEGNWSDPINPPFNLVSWKGYTVKNLSNKNVSIKLKSPSSPASQKIADESAGIQWMLSLTASSGEAVDRANHFGICDYSSDEWDKFDHVEPPGVGGYVSVYFPHPDWLQYPDNYTVDFRPPTTKCTAWDVDVKTNIPEEPVTVTITGADQLPDNLSYIVKDRDTGEKVTVSDDIFSFRSGAGTSERHFTIMVTDENDHPDEPTTAPKMFVTATCYPNPFNPSTTIRYELSQPGEVTIIVYNTLGQHVSTIREGYRNRGTHEVVFTSPDLTSGVYIFRVDAGYTHTTGKMLYMK